MKRFVGLATVLLAVSVGLSGCARPVTPQAPSVTLAKAIKATEQKISATGFVAKIQVHGGSQATEVFDPKDNGGLFVNDAVMVDSALNFRQISRQTSDQVRSFLSAAQVAEAHVGATLDFAAYTFKVESKKVTEKSGEYVEALKLTEQDGQLGTFLATVRFGIKGGLISQVSFDKGLFDPTAPEEVCSYAPTNCVESATYDYTASNVAQLMGEAFGKYEQAQSLAVGPSHLLFEQIMRDLDQTYKTYKSWTVQNADSSAGAVFDAATGNGVTFDSYDSPQIFDASQAGSGRFGPDNGFVSSIFFDTTDGGSTYFFGPITFDAAQGVYTVHDTSGSEVATFTFVNHVLQQYVDSTFGHDVYTVRGQANKDLLAREAVKATHL